MSLAPLNVEIGGAVFNTVKGLRSLIAATGEDDVHSQVVIAAGYLGALIPAAAKRIDEAIDALGGQSSIPVENLKASIGISFGGLCKILRQETPLLQFFTFCAACKTTLLDDECGTLVFQMLEKSRILQRYPCSTAQITRMISQVASQADKIAPVNVMHEVAIAVDEWHPEGDAFRRMDLPKLAELFLALFEYMSDEAVDSIILEGHSNCIWIASSLLWLFDDRACLLINEQMIQGNPKAKLCIQVEPHESIPWSLQVFKSSEHPVEYVFKMPQDEEDSLSQIPLKSLKSFMNHYYWDDFEDAATRRRAMIISGKIAQTLIVAISLQGKLYLACKGCEGRKHCNEAHLSLIAQSSWLAGVEHVILEYGWTEHDHAEFDPKLLEQIVACIDKWRSCSTENFRQTDINITGIYETFIQNNFPGQTLNNDYILDPALSIAADAAVTCSTILMDAHRFIKPLDHNTLRFAEQAVIQLLSGGLEVSEFRERAFKQLLPGLGREWHAGDLAITRDGYVAAMNLLWTERAMQPDALSIRMQRGQIKNVSATYQEIRENAFVSKTLNIDQRVQAFDAIHGLMMPGIGPKHKIKDRAYTFETSASVHGTRIEIKRYMVYFENISKISDKRKASWINAINLLAMSTHLDIESQLTAQLNESLNARLTRQLATKDVCWTDAYYAPSSGVGVRTLMRTGANPKVKVFAASVCKEVRESCCYIVVRHRCPLMRCIEKAERDAPKHSSSWIVVD